VCGEPFENVERLLRRGGDDRSQSCEGLSAVERAERAGDFHLHLYHAQRLFGPRLLVK
jgi:hypothetical protein